MRLQITVGEWDANSIFPGNGDQTIDFRISVLRIELRSGVVRTFEAHFRYGLRDRFEHASRSNGYRIDACDDGVYLLVQRLPERLVAD